MSNLKKNRLGLLVATSFVIAILAAQGCSSSSDSGQVTPTGGKPNSGGTGGSGTTAGTGGKAGSSSTAGSAGKTSTGGTGGTTAIGEGGAAGAPIGAAGAGACDGPDGCYSCKPTTNPQFANHCITGGCPATFDNSTLTEIAKVGTL